MRQTSEPFRSALVELFRQRTEALVNVVIEAYARGLSTRDVEELLADEDGRPLVSKDAVTELTEALWEDYQAFTKRDLSPFEVEYIFVDAVFEPVRSRASDRSMREKRGLKEAILAAWAICADGQKVLLHLALGNKESYDSWLDFLRNMVAHGLKTPVLVTSDGAPGLIRAIESVWPESLRQRCLTHKKRNIPVKGRAADRLSKLPQPAVPQFRAHLDAVWYAATYEAGQQAATVLIERFGDFYPSAVSCFVDDLDASLNHLKCPVVHRKAIRTTNLLERAFGEEKRRTKVIPRFFNEKSCLKLVFAVLIRASDRWRRVPMSDLERKQLKDLRQELFKTQPAQQTLSRVA